MQRRDSGAGPGAPPRHLGPADPVPAVEAATPASPGEVPAARPGEQVEEAAPAEGGGEGGAAERAAGAEGRPVAWPPAAAAAPSPPPSCSLGWRPGSQQGCGSQLAEAAAAPATGSHSLTARVLLWLGVLQVAMGCSVAGLNFWALSASRPSQVDNGCPVWSGFSAILSGVLNIGTWKKPVMVLANLFITLSVICFVMTLSGFVLGYHGLQHVPNISRCDLDSSGNEICFCCEGFRVIKCTEGEIALELHQRKSCSAVQLALKNVFIALCVLNGITATVCMVTSAVQYLRILANRRTFLNECDAQDHDVSSESDDFVSSVLGPNYFTAFYSRTPQMSHREWNEDVAVSCPLEPPPPYEAAWVRNSSEQEGAPQVSSVEVVDSGELSDRQASQGEEVPESSSRASLLPSNASLVPVEEAHGRVFNSLLNRSKSVPVLHSSVFQGAVLSSQAETQAEVKQLYATTLQKSLREITSRGKLQSLIDWKSYTDTKQLVASILDQSSCSMNPDVTKLMDNTNSVLKSDEKRMAEVATGATFLKQVMASDQQAMSLRAHVLPFRMLPGLLHLETCGDLSSFTTGEGCLAETNDPESRA